MRTLSRRQDALLSTTFSTNLGAQQTHLKSQLISRLRCCQDVTYVKQVHARIYRWGLDQCSFVLTKVIRRISELGLPMDPYPRRVFEQVHDPNPFLWTALIRGYALSGQLNVSVGLYTSMRSSTTRPLSFTFSALLSCCSGDNHCNLGRQMHGQVIKIGGFESDLLVNNTLVDMYLNCGDLECGRKLFDEIPERDVVTMTSMVAAYAKSGEMGMAKYLFDGFPVKDSVAWTAIVTGYAQNGKPEEALKLFERMLNDGAGVDQITLASAVSACAQLGASKYATWVQDIAENCGFDPHSDIVFGSALVDMYSKCGMLDDAYEMFEQMSERNVYTYSSMISGLAMHGRATMAYRLFHEMVNSGVKPNSFTFMGLLTACSHGGMIEEGRKIFYSMEKFYSVKPSLDHYTCMVDLLGRAGLLEEALDFAESIPLESNSGVWGALLGACRVYGNADIAEVAASHLFELEPNCRGNYILLCNIYTSAGRWDDVSRVRKLIRTNKNMERNPARSWFERERGEIHEFFAGDVTHPMSDGIVKALEELLHQLAPFGYQPNLSSFSFDVSDDDKIQRFMTHSEKLALGYALLSTNDDSTIRIMKNLRICDDCHLFMCATTRIIGRKIIVRDSMRFHHFEDGNCSCGNFW